jgi:nucleoside-diphosphate-sugar epimerase
MRVVVTGAGGRIGRPTVAELVEHGHQVVAFDLVPPSAPFPPGVQLRLGTVDDAGSVLAVLRQARAEAVVHLARASSNHDELTIYRSNIMGTYHVLQAAVACNLGVAVVASSIQALGDYWSLRQAPRYLPLDEAHPCAPRGAYQTAKLVVEETSRAITLECDLPTVAIRPTAVIVPERWPEIRRQVAAAGSTAPGNRPLVGGTLAAYVDARDVAQLIRLAVEHAGRGDLRGAHVLHASGADAFGDAPLAAVMAQHYPAAAGTAANLVPGQPGISIEAPRRLLGYAPRYRWREMVQER